MTTLVLERYGSTSMGVFGELIVNDIKLFTVEQPWRNNKPYKSCIPAGEYQLVPHDSKKYGETWAMVNHDLSVSHYKEANIKRFACLFHKANYAKQLQGCIAPGKSLGSVSAEWAVVQSGDAFKILLAALPRGGDHKLIIRWQNNGEGLNEI